MTKYYVVYSYNDPNFEQRQTQAEILSTDSSGVTEDVIREWLKKIHGQHLDAEGYGVVNLVLEQWNKLDG